MERQLTSSVGDDCVRTAECVTPHYTVCVVDMIGAPAGVNTAVGLAAGTAAAVVAVASNQDDLLLNTPGAT